MAQVDIAVTTQVQVESTPTTVNDSTNTKSDVPKKKRVNIKGKFPNTMTPAARQDVIALKQRLADALGENGPLYWDALKDFVAGKLNRQEFDFYANLYLSQENGKDAMESCLPITY